MMYRWLVSIRYVSLIIGILIGFSLLIRAGSDNKDVAYFEKHPDQLFASAMDCSRLPDKEALTNKTCLAIKELEKPQCESELRMMGRISTPRGWVYNCDDPYYLMARPVIEAKMKAALAEQPDPVEAYLRAHPDKHS